MRALGTVVLVAGLAAGASAAPMRLTADGVASAARRAGVARVAVLPLDARGGPGGAPGEELADELTGALVRDARVRVVERARLPDVMGERRLGAAGASDGAAEELLTAADAVVTGVYARRGSRVRATVRLVSARTGEILAAFEEDFPWTMPEPPAEPAAAAADKAWGLVVAPPAFTVKAPDLGDDPLEFKDAPNDLSCDGAAARADAILAGVLELKARHWASQLKKGYPPYAVTRNPGSEFHGSELKERFYDSLKGWYARAFVPELGRSEFERMSREDARAAALNAACGL